MRARRCQRLWTITGRKTLAVKRWVASIAVSIRSSHQRVHSSSILSNASSLISHNSIRRGTFANAGGLKQAIHTNLERHNANPQALYEDEERGDRASSPKSDALETLEAIKCAVPTVRLGSTNAQLEFGAVFSKVQFERVRRAPYHAPVAPRHDAALTRSCACGRVRAPGDDQR